MELFIDNREHGLVAIFNANCNTNVIQKIEPLDVGDVQFRFDGRLACVVERKTMEDLQSSINDGRYKEQKLRLLQTREETGCIIVYILERSLQSNNRVLDFTCMNSGMVGSILNTCLRDRIFVLQTSGLEDTAAALDGMWKRFVKEPLIYFGENAGTMLSKTAHTDALIKTKRKGNIDGETCFLMQLSCIPSISMKKAQAIAAHFQVNTIGSLVHALADQVTRVKKLSEVDGVGKVLAKCIAEHLFTEK